MLHKRGSRHVPNSSRVFVCPNDTLTNLTLSNGENTQTFLANAADGDIALFCPDERGIWSTVNTDIWAGLNNNAYDQKEFFVGQKVTVGSKTQLRRTHELSINGLSVSKSASRLGNGTQQIVHSWVFPTDLAGNLIGGDFIIGLTNNSTQQALYERMSFQVNVSDSVAAGFANEVAYLNHILDEFVLQINDPNHPNYLYAGVQVYTAAKTTDPATTTVSGLVISTTVADETFDAFIPYEAVPALVEKTPGNAIDGTTIQEYLLDLGSYPAVHRHELDSGRIMDGYTFTNVMNQDLYAQYGTFSEVNCFYTEYTINGHYHIKTSAPNEQEHYQMFEVHIFVKETTPHTASTLLDTVFTSAPLKTITVA